MSVLSQRSFAAGELAPALHPRCDTVKHATGLRTMRNFMVMKHGGASSRPGTEFVNEIKDSSAVARLIKFVFDSTQTYILEFGAFYIRFYKDGTRVTVSGVTAWDAGTAYVLGDLASLAGVNYYCILAHTNHTPVNATYWYALTGSIYEIPSPYAAADLDTLRIVQSADVITIASSGYDPRELSRLGATDWTLTSITFGPSISAPTGLTTGAAGSATIYTITSVTAGGEESYQANTYGTSIVPSVGTPASLTWTTKAGAATYNLYRVENGIAAFIGSAGSNAFVDDGIEPDPTITPPATRDPITSGKPACVAYIQQRLTFGNTVSEPETVYMSRTGFYHNFTVSNPGQDDDAVTFAPVGRQVNQIKHLIDVGKFVVFTASGEWVVNGDQTGAITPSNSTPKQQTYNGSGELAPLIIDGDVLYVQARGSIVRDLAFDYQIDGYRGNDLTVFSAHLLDGYTIVDWDYQQIPNSIVWIVRDDGTLLGLTYIREQEILGWHRHDLAGGIVENVCVVPENDVDVVYLIVKRTVNSSTKRYIEKLSERRVDDILDYIGMDCALTYDGRNTGSTTMTLSGGSTWAYDETMTLTASASTFSAGDVGNQIQLTGSDGTFIRFTINHYTSATVVTGKPSMTVPAGMRSAAMLIWARAVDAVSGLSHLEGKHVSVLGDGFVVASPNNSAYDLVTVSSGAIALDACYAVIHVGLPFLPDMETLDIDTAQAESLVDKKKLVGKVTAHLQDSRGMWAGPKPPTDDDDDPLENLTELKIRDNETMDEPVDLATGSVEIQIKSEWNTNGRVFIRQVDPLPLSILALHPTGMLSARGG